MTFRLLFFILLAVTSQAFGAESSPTAKPTNPKGKKADELELCCDPAEADSTVKAEVKKEPAKPTPKPEKKK